MDTARAEYYAKQAELDARRYEDQRKDEDRNFKLMRNALYSAIAMFGVYFGILLYLVATASR